MRRVDGNENGQKKSVGLISKKSSNTLFLNTSLPLFCTTRTWNFQKLPSYTFYGGNVVRDLITFFSLPLIFTLVAASISHFLTAALKCSRLVSFVFFSHSSSFSSKSKQTLKFSQRKDAFTCNIRVQLSHFFVFRLKNDKKFQWANATAIRVCCKWIHLENRLFWCCFYSPLKSGWPCDLPPKRGGYKCQLSVKISAICQLSVKFCHFKFFVSCYLNGY